MNISLLKNLQFYHILVFPLQHMLVKDYPHNLTKYETKGDSKIPIFQLFGEKENLS